jgi:hypothetical protein
MRIGNEWGYAVTGGMYPFVKYRYKMKLLENNLCVKYYIVATLLRNANLCLYAGLTSDYFNCDYPDLEDYFQV